MSTASRRSPSFQIPGFGQNAVLQLIIASGTGFIMYHLVRVTLIVFGFTLAGAQNAVTPFVALKSINEFPSHFWTLLTYGWIHNGLFEWISNMVWLYCFGNALQMQVNYRQVIPVYIYGLLGGGVFFLLSQLIPGLMPQGSLIVMTGQAGVMALMAAVVTLNPQYRFYLGESFSIPLLLVAGIYLVLTLFSYQHPAMIALDLGGLLTGFLVMTAVKNGRNPGGWMYRLPNAASNWAEPKNSLSFRDGSKRRQILNNLKPQQHNNQKKIDDILDKINQRGYNALTTEERDLLMRASKEDK